MFTKPNWIADRWYCYPSWWVSGTTSDAQYGWTLDSDCTSGPEFQWNAKLKLDSLDIHLMILHLYRRKAFSILLSFWHFTIHTHCHCNNMMTVDAEHLCKTLPSPIRSMYNACQWVSLNAGLSNNCCYRPSWSPHRNTATTRIKFFNSSLSKKCYYLNDNFY